MKSDVHKSFWVVLPIVPFLLLSNAFAQHERMKSKNSEFYESRGLAYLEKRQYGKAISDFNRVLRVNPGDASAYCNRGRAYGEQGQNDLAISDYTKALEINPGDAGTYYARGFSYYFKKEYEKSWTDVKKAQSLGYSIHPRFLDDLANASGIQGRAKSKKLSSG